MRELRIRPHHLLCIGYFEGRGYSDSFSRSMAQIKELTMQNPKITVSCSADEVCRACPNRVESGCRTQEKVMRYDREVLKLLEIEEGMHSDWNSLRKMTEEKILNCRKREEICGDCEWNEICRKNEDGANERKIPDSIE